MTLTHAENLQGMYFWFRCLDDLHVNNRQPGKIHNHPRGIAGEEKSRIQLLVA